MKKVKDYQHGCEILGLDPEAKPDVSKIREKDQKAFIGLFELTIIIEAQNKLDDFVVDMGNTDQIKYNPWHWIEKDESKVSGVGLSCHDCDYSDLSTTVGSRLVLGNRTSAKYIGTEFIPLYELWEL